MIWLQTLGPTLLMVIGGIITWIIRTKLEELRAIEEKIRDERHKTYTCILEPYIRILADQTGKEQSHIFQKITSFEYRKTLLDLVLVGSDKVVQSFNECMQYVFKTEKGTAEFESKEMLRLWGEFLLAIRKDLGNKKTKLDPFDMFKGVITDIDKILKTNGKGK